MSDTAARAFLDRVSEDETFAAELDALKDDPDAVLAKAHAAGFDATQHEIHDAFLEHYGAELSPEQLDAVAAGLDQGGANALIAAGSGAVALAVTVAAAAAAGS